MTRAPLALAFVFCVGATSASAADLSDLPPEQAAIIESKLDALDAAGIPSARIEQKLREGRAKKVPPARIVQAVVRLADGLLWAAQQLSECAQSEPEARQRLVELAAELLFDSVSRADLTPALERLCHDEAAAAKLSQASGLYSFVLHKLAASSETAWALAFELMRRGEAEGAVNGLTRVLQEIYRSKRSIDRPLGIAVARLRAGASVRAVRNELRDQFLRR